MDQQMMPNTASPDYADRAAQIRGYFDGRRAVFVLDDPDGDSRTALELRRAQGRAPFVGDPRLTRGYYEWTVALDRSGGGVAGPAQLHLVDWYG